MDWLRTFWVCHLMLSLFWYQILLLPIGKFDEEQKWWGKHSALTFSNKWIFIGNPVRLSQLRRAVKGLMFYIVPPVCKSRDTCIKL